MKPLLLAILLAPSLASAGDPAAVTAFFGNYRVREYNGVKNEYSNRFFTPSVNVEPSAKLRHENGGSMRTLNFNFEVPLVKDDGTIFLKFLFPEFPLDGAELTEVEGGVHLSFDGRVQESVSTALGRFWPTCEAHYEAELRKLSDEESSFELVKNADKPCTSEQHSFRVQRVRELP